MLQNCQSEVSRFPSSGPVGAHPTEKSTNINQMKHTKLSMLLVGAVAFATAPLASAIPTLYFDINDDATLDGVVVDGFLGDLAIGTAGLVGSSFTAGGYNVSTLAATKPNIGSAQNPQMANVNLTISGPGTIAIYFVENGFGPSGTGFSAELTVNDLLSDGLTTTNYYSYASIAAFGGIFSGAGAPMTTLTEIDGG